MLGKQLKGEIKPKDLYPLMTDDKAMNRILEKKKHNRSVDKRVSERMYYERQKGV